jgi:hypothetical protein
VHRFAIACEDSSDLIAHFGKATRFWVGEIHNGLPALIDIRRVHPYASRPGRHQFDARRMDALCAVLQDCEKVYIRAIGEKPRRHFQQWHIEPVLCEGNLNDCLAFGIQTL